MARQADLVGRVRAALADTPDVSEKKMFGSVGFMVRGKLCVSAREERIMCRIDPAIHDEATLRPGCTTMALKGREYRGYVHVDASVLKTARDLTFWVDRALAYNAAITTTKRNKKK